MRGRRLNSDKISMERGILVPLERCGSSLSGSQPELGPLRCLVKGRPNLRGVLPSDSASAIASSHTGEAGCRDSAAEHYSTDIIKDLVEGFL